jgi:hypothetical protein
MERHWSIPTLKPDHSSHRTLQVAAAVAVAALLSSCVGAPPIQPAATSKSHFEGNDYHGDTLTLNRPTPGEESYRVFEQARTGEVPLQSVRSGAEEKARAYCNGKGRAMRGLVETAARPPYIQGNFARVELIFECIAKPG